MLHACWLPPRDRGCFMQSHVRRRRVQYADCNQSVPKQIPRIVSGRTASPGQYGRCTGASASVLETVCWGKQPFVPFVPAPEASAIYRGRLPCHFNFAPYLRITTTQACLGAGNARIFFAGVFCIPNHKLPECPGAGNARQFIGGRFLCKIWTTNPV